MRTEIEIIHVSQTGQGVGYDEDKHIYFVEGALPGDTAEISFSAGQRRYRDADLVSIKRPSPERVASVCPYFPECGGCDWLHWDYHAQTAAKDRLLDHLLDRNGLSFRERRPIIEAPMRLGYRNRIQLHHRGGKIGFYRRRSHEIVDIEYCHLAHPELNRALNDIRRRRDDSELGERFELLLDGKGAVQVFGQAESESFVQVNPSQNENLRRLVAECVRGGDGKNILELYCGDGNLTFAYRPPDGRIIAVDSSRAAIEKARNRDDGIGAGIEFLQMHIDGTLTGKLPADFKNEYDTLILDPPRGGTDLTSHDHRNVKNIIYVSCSPSTFVRDVRSLEEGFSFETFQAIDMFPQSRHVELVAHLKRSQQ